MIFKYSTIPKNASHTGIYVKTIKKYIITTEKYLFYKDNSVFLILFLICT